MAKMHPRPQLHFKFKHQKMLYFLKQGMLRRLNYIRKEFSILLNSRIIQFFMLMPFMYLSYRLGKQLYIEQVSYRYPGSYIKPASPLKDRLASYFGSLVGDLLSDP